MNEPKEKRIAPGDNKRPEKIKLPVMKKIIALVSLLLVVASFVRAQKPARLQINSLLMKIPIPQSSSACYAVCTTTTDASGFASIKDNGPVFNSLQSDLTAMMTGDRSDMQSGAATPAAAQQPPTAEQIAQMQQDAMARAQALSQGGANPAAAMQAQANANRKPPAVNPAIMQGLGKASGAAMQIQTLVRELGQKVAAVNMPIVHSEPNCPEVRQGSYVGPTCACTYARSVTGEQKRVDARDIGLQQQAALMNEYRHLIQDQVAIIDKLESDAKYGDGITDQTVLSMLWSAQRQGLSGIVSFLSIANGVWTDGARVYLDLVNAKANHCK
jgi:hypothetical protein